MQIKVIYLLCISEILLRNELTEAVMSTKWKISVLGIYYCVNLTCPKQSPFRSLILVFVRTFSTLYMSESVAQGSHEAQFIFIKTVTVL